MMNIQLCLYLTIPEIVVSSFTNQITIFVIFLKMYLTVLVPVSRLATPWETHSASYDAILFRFLTNGHHTSSYVTNDELQFPHT
jgi:hypothetical protein